MARLQRVHVKATQATLPQRRRFGVFGAFCAFHCFHRQWRLQCASRFSPRKTTHTVSTETPNSSAICFRARSFSFTIPRKLAFCASVKAVRLRCGFVMMHSSDHKKAALFRFSLHATQSSRGGRACTTKQHKKQLNGNFFV